MYEVELIMCVVDIDFHLTLLSPGPEDRPLDALCALETIQPKHRNSEFSLNQHETWTRYSQDIVKIYLNIVNIVEI